MRLILICALFCLTACGSGSKKAETETNTSIEYSSAYVCPMHCEGSGSDSAGYCPVCGMEYIKNESFKAKENE